MSKAALDFVRLATWDISEHTFLLSDVLTEYPGEFEPGSWLQYRGWKKDGYFLGTGEQKKKRHSVVNVSGYRADRNYKYLLTRDTYYATRIDVQITIQKPGSIDLSDIYDELKKQEIKTSLIQSEKNDTLYVGARTSDVFVRLYEKPLDIMYLRLEFEFKGKAARNIWRALRTGSTPDEVFQYYLDRCKLPFYVKSHYNRSQDGGTSFAIKKEIEKTDSKKLAWLQSCDSSVRQALYNHNIGDAVCELVMSWANEAANVDIINELD